MRFVIMFILLSLVNLLNAQQVRQNIAVLDLDPTGIAEADAQFLSERLRTELFETGYYQVIERNKMQEILKEQGFQNSGCTSVQCAVEIGELLNVKGIVAGAIGKIDDIYSISLRLIEVQTGAIMRTATEDYRGSLSEVLTEVIPRVAGQLAVNYDLPAAMITDLPQVETGYSLAVKFGIAILGYTSSQNEAIASFRDSVGASLDDFSNHSTFVFEGIYTLNADWEIRLGLAVQNMLSPWQADFSIFPEKYENLHFERSYRFVNLYLGANYTFWRPNEKYSWYVGYDLGSTTLQTDVKSSYKTLSGSEYQNDDSFSYSKFTLKLNLGLGYRLSDSFQAGVEIGTQIVGDYDTSNEQIPENFPDVMTAVLYPENIVASGVRFDLFVVYKF